MKSISEAFRHPFYSLKGTSAISRMRADSPLGAKGERGNGVCVTSVTKLTIVSIGLVIVLMLIMAPVYAQNEEIMTIRTVFHVVYASGEQNISEDQIRSQLQVLNRDYRGLNRDSDQTQEAFKNVVSDARIQFVLADLDENGSATDGITRTSTTHGPFGNNDLYQTALGGIDPWDPNKYLNIWVADLAPGILGNASPPGSTDFDGVTIDYENLGIGSTAIAPYNAGRTVTHEIGHWLGLSHLWGETGDCDGDDGLDDTPNMTRTFGDCNLSQSTCGSTDMVQNFMNLEVDACLTFFTLDQTNLIRSTLLNQRSGVITETQVVTAIDIKKDLQKILVHPNPSQTGIFNLHLELDGPAILVKVADLMGRVVLEDRHINIEHYRVDLSSYPQGVYWILVKLKNRIIYQRIIYES